MLHFLKAVAHVARTYVHDTLRVGISVPCIVVKIQLAFWKEFLHPPRQAVGDFVGLESIHA